MNPIRDEWQSDDGSVRLILGDCLQILATLEADLLCTDPPYGLNLGKHSAASEKRMSLLRKKAYESYDDSEENFIRVVVPAVKLALDQTKRGMVFAAPPPMWNLPPPRAIGGFFIPFGCGRTAWGFTAFSHCLLYGSAPDVNLGCKATGKSNTETPEANGHPCPKPLGWMTWAVELGSRVGEVVVDPFMGSGTTGVACVRTGRRFVGIEIEPKYWEIAVRRVRAELELFPLFERQSASLRQLEFPG